MISVNIIENIIYLLFEQIFKNIGDHSNRYKHKRFNVIFTLQGTIVLLSARRRIRGIMRDEKIREGILCPWWGTIGF